MNHLYDFGCYSFILTLQSLKFKFRFTNRCATIHLPFFHHSFTSKKLLPLHNRDKSINSCGTTLIGLNGPLTPHTFICAPLITGGVPVGYYSLNAFVPPSKAHSKRLLLPQSHHLRLSLKRLSESTILSHRFNLQFTLIICRSFMVVKYLDSRKFFKAISLFNIHRRA